jgi:hypothetical protein
MQCTVSKVVPLHAMKVYSSIHYQPAMDALPVGREPPYPLNNGLGGSHSQSEHLASVQAHIQDILLAGGRGLRLFICIICLILKNYVTKIMSYIQL